MKKSLFIALVLVILSANCFSVNGKTKIKTNKSKLEFVKEFSIYVEPTSMEMIISVYGNMKKTRIVDKEIKKMTRDTISGSKNFVIYKLTKNAEAEELYQEIRKNKLKPIPSRVLVLAYYELVNLELVPIWGGVTSFYKSNDKNREYPIIVNTPGVDKIEYIPLKDMYEKGTYIVLLKQ